MTPPSTGPVRGDERGQAALARVAAVNEGLRHLGDDVARYAREVEKLTDDLATVDDLAEYADDLETLADEIDILCAVHRTNPSNSPNARPPADLSLNQGDPAMTPLSPTPARRLGGMGPADRAWVEEETRARCGQRSTRGPVCVPTEKQIQEAAALAVTRASSGRQRGG